MTQWALTLAYALHILATVIWIGGMAALVLWIVPAARRSLPAESYSALMSSLKTRLSSTGWFSLAVLTATGMFQMSANSNYQGFLAIENSWAVAILIKHAAVGGMVVVSAAITWGVMPGLQRMALLRASGRGSPEVLEKLEQRELLLMRLNLVLGAVVLLLTAWARAA